MLPPEVTEVFKLVDQLPPAVTNPRRKPGLGKDRSAAERGHALLLRQAQLALRKSEDRVRALIEKNDNVIALLGAAGTVLYASPPVAKILGFEPDELVGQNVIGFLHPEDRARGTELFSELRASPRKSLTLALRYLHKDGGYRWLEGKGANFLDEPGVASVVFAYRDISERKRLEEHFLQAQKMEALGQFSGGVAHDFNNILATISGYTELAQMTLKGNPDVREHLGAVMRATDRATALVRQILTFSRQHPLDRRPIQLGMVLAKSLKQLRSTVPLAIEIETSAEDDVPAVLADADQVQQALMHLGVNAWHSMKDDRGLIQVNLERCEVDAAHATTHPRLHPGVYARISVTDNGCGMDQGTLRRIFEPFFTTKPHGQGIGLGLSVVDGVMDSHDGTVAVHSRIGEGTMFHLYFPKHVHDEAATPGEELRAPLGCGERILVVDDEKLLARLSQKALTALDYEVEVAFHPAAALDMVRADPDRFATVITDLTMPGMSGVILATKIIKMRPNMPIILMTGYTASLTPERFEVAGIHRLLLKPTTIDSLGIAVHAALSAESGR